MKASAIAQNINACVKIYRDRELVYLSARKDSNGKIYSEEESITSVKVYDNREDEPITIFGNNYNQVMSEPLIQLNWLGRLLRKFIIKEFKVINPPPLNNYFFNKK